MTVLRAEHRTHPFMTHQYTPLPALAFQHISDAIIEARLQPGDAINLQRIALNLDMSLNPVREAIVRLRDIGLVEVTPARYTKVADFTAPGSLGAIEYAGVLAGAALRSTLSTTTPELRSELASIVEEIVDAETTRIRAAAVREFLASVADLVAFPRQAAHLIETTLLAQCVLRYGPFAPRTGTIRHQLSAAASAAHALRAGDPAASETSVRELLHLLA